MARQRKRRKFGLVKLALWGVLLLGIVLAAGAGALMLLGMPTYDVPRPKVTVEATPERVARGKRLVSMLCRRCHLDGESGTLQGRVLEELPKSLGIISAPNITRDPGVGIGEWSAAEVAVLLRTGLNPKTGALVPPPVMPRWPGLADEDLLSILAYLESDDPWVAASSKEPEPTQYSLRAKFRAITSWDPLPYPRTAIEAPDPSRLEAYGAYLVDQVLQCTSCHGEAWGTIDYANPKETPGYLGGGAVTNDVNDVVLRAANLTPHETGLGNWTSEELGRALIDGFGPDGKIVRWPMLRYPALESGDVEAIYTYLQTLAPVDNEIEPSPPYRMIGRKADGGVHLYTLYGCHYCHGQSGVGVADLRDAMTRMPTDEELIAYLEDPSREDPLTLMPSWKGVIPPEDYPELCEFIRRLGQKKKDADDRKKKSAKGK